MNKSKIDSMRKLSAAVKEATRQGQYKNKYLTEEE